MYCQQNISIKVYSRIHFSWFFLFFIILSSLSSYHSGCDHCLGLSSWATHAVSTSSPLHDQLDLSLYQKATVASFASHASHPISPELSGTSP